MHQPDNITFRKAEAGDIDALNTLIDRAYRGDAARAGWTHEADLLGGQRIDPPGIAEMLAAPHQHLLVAVAADGSIIGCVEISYKQAGLAYLGLLSVAPWLQARGLGKRLIAEAEHFASKRLDAARMEMTVIRQRPELIAFYERRGYRLTGEQRPFPYGNPRFGAPRTDDLVFVVLARDLG